MATYISLVNYTDQGIRDIKNAAKRLSRAKKEMAKMGVKFKSFYLTLGGYDVVTIVEAPNDEAAAKAVLATASAGNVRTTTLKAFTESEFRKIIKDLP